MISLWGGICYVLISFLKRKEIRPSQNEFQLASIHYAYICRRCRVSGWPKSILITVNSRVSLAADTVARSLSVESFRSGANFIFFFPWDRGDSFSPRALRERKKKVRKEGTIIFVVIGKKKVRRAWRVHEMIHWKNLPEEMWNERNLSFW